MLTIPSISRPSQYPVPMLQYIVSFCAFSRHRGMCLTTKLGSKFLQTWKVSRMKVSNKCYHNSSSQNINSLLTVPTIPDPGCWNALQKPIGSRGPTCSRVAQMKTYKKHACNSIKYHIKSFQIWVKQVDEVHQDNFNLFMSSHILKVSSMFSCPMSGTPAPSGHKFRNALKISAVYIPCHPLTTWQKAAKLCWRGVCVCVCVCGPSQKT